MKQEIVDIVLARERRALHRQAPVSLARVAGLVMTLFAYGCALAEPDVRPPSSAQDVLQVVKQIIDDRALAVDAFFTREELARRFGEQVDITIGAADGVARQAFVKGFETLADRPRGKVPPDGISMAFYKYADPQGRMVCHLRASFTGISNGLRFESVVERLGPTWRRDSAAENRRFFAHTSETFNPPFPKSSATMGHAIIVYGEDDRSMTLEFAPDGTLAFADRRRLPC